MELIRVAASEQAMLNGAAVSPMGRVFSSFPRWTPVPSPSVAEAIIVVDLASGAARKVLANHRLTLADPNATAMIQGREFRARNGGVPQVHVDLLELSGDGKWLYFAALLGPMLRRVPTMALQDVSLSDDEVAATVEDVIGVPPLAGLARDARDNLYICSFTQDAILRLKPGAKVLETLITDPRISFPNEGCVGPDGYFYFPGSQIHRSARFGDGTSQVQLPFEVMKILIAEPRD